MGSKDKKSKDRKRDKDENGTKRKLDAEDGPAAAAAPAGRTYTLSIAVAASCIENAQNLELATLLAGQIARAAAIFNVDEVVVLDDSPDKAPGRVSAAAALFARVLQFMETPQYIKKALIPMHPDLKYAGMLPPLDAPHHLRSTEWGPFREGVVRRSAPGEGSWLDVGLDRDAHIPQAVKQGVRVTLAMGEQPTVTTAGGQQVLQAALALPTDPRERAGLYWGYLTRMAPSLAALREQCPFSGGYDLVVGTSERGEQTAPCALSLGSFRHALVVFGGPQGLEYALQNDELAARHAEPSTLFDRYLNTCFDQGSRTIRSEEAILISLAFLQPALGAAQRGDGGGR
ncbi:methyltransferase C9orf114-like protein isoform X2 [Micractinium conductrix]|uniref:Methyltransferase C9orf114-like protein isoform X2 n=1 Tax=Micractinium conductrix TaxID=554055 RepID=A0A2P6VIV4_9CHLO|nr:methyltransferase C9orf114-like protein isoform X2 [Micractinium conductrix]|eukprot:PSC74008.1 methyltransferase C9orf114-like protein isoform X2 [Micractinium conductrix]